MEEKKRSVPAYLAQAQDKTLIVYLPKEVDDFSCGSIPKDTEHILHEYPDIRRMIFDFSETEFMDSTGIGIILSRYRRMKERDGRVAIYGADRRVERLLRISGILQIAEMLGSGSEAEEMKKSIGGET